MQIVVGWQAVGGGEAGLSTGVLTLQEKRCCLRWVMLGSGLPASWSNRCHLRLSAYRKPYCAREKPFRIPSSWSLTLICFFSTAEGFRARSFKTLKSPRFYRRSLPKPLWFFFFKTCLFVFRIKKTELALKSKPIYICNFKMQLRWMIAFCKWNAFTAHFLFWE